MTRLGVLQEALDMIRVIPNKRALIEQLQAKIDSEVKKNGDN